MKPVNVHGEIRDGSLNDTRYTDMRYLLRVDIMAELDQTVFERTPNMTKLIILWVDYYD